MTGQTFSAGALVMETPVTWSPSRWTCEGRRVAPPSVPLNSPTLLYANRITNVRTHYSGICDGVGGEALKPLKEMRFVTGHAWRSGRYTVVSLSLSLSWKRMGGVEGTCVLGPRELVWRATTCLFRGLKFGCLRQRMQRVRDTAACIRRDIQWHVPCSGGQDKRDTHILVWGSLDINVVSHPARIKVT